LLGFRPLKRADNDGMAWRAMWPPSACNEVHMIYIVRNCHEWLSSESYTLTKWGRGVVHRFFFVSGSRGSEIVPWVVPLDP
jgi:hypothetical protein